MVWFVYKSKNVKCIKRQHPSNPETNWMYLCFTGGGPTALTRHRQNPSMEVLVAARAPKSKSTWDRQNALASIQSRSQAHERLYGDANGPKRNARSIRERERISMARPPPSSKPEGYALMLTSPMGFSSRREERVKYKEKGELTARGRDMNAAENMSKKKVRG